MAIPLELENPIEIGTVRQEMGMGIKSSAIEISQKIPTPTRLVWGFR